MTQEGETITMFGDSGPEKLNRPTSCIPYKNMFLVADGDNNCIKGNKEIKMDNLTVHMVCLWTAPIIFLYVTRTITEFSSFL